MPCILLFELIKNFFAAFPMFVCLALGSQRSLCFAFDQALCPTSILIIPFTNAIAASLRSFFCKDWLSVLRFFIAPNPS